MYHNLMGYLGLGYSGYKEYLRSHHFIQVKKRAFKKGTSCAICGKKWDLQAHHLLYQGIGKRWEYLTIRFLCSKHHRRVSYILGVVKVPNKARYMIPVYIANKYLYKLFHAPISFCLWAYSEYRVSEQQKTRKSNHRLRR